MIPQLSLGGAGRALIAAAKYSSRLADFRHDVVSLRRADRRAINLAGEAGITVFATPSKQALWRQMEDADLVQFHYWNAPELREVFIGDLPAMRSLVLFEVNRQHPPHVITPDIVDWTNIVVAASPRTLDLSIIRSLKSDRSSWSFPEQILPALKDCIPSLMHHSTLAISAPIQTIRRTRLRSVAVFLVSCPGGRGRWFLRGGRECSQYPARLRQNTCPI